MARVTVVVHASAPPAHLRECLISLAQQSFRDLDVVVVRDGTPDAERVTAELATQDGRFRVLDETRAEAGAARDLGAAAAAGEYLAFVDGHDVLPPRAYEHLVAGLDGSGSDFATGKVRVLGEPDATPSPELGDVHVRTRPRTHVSRLPVLLRDRPVTNKLFRRSSWESFGLRFGELGDAAVSLPAHVLAGAVDVVAEPVYLTRVRADDEHVYGRMPGPVLRNRLATLRAVSLFMAGHADRPTLLRYHDQVLTGELAELLCVLDLSDDEDQQHAMDVASEYLATVPRRSLDRLPAIDRLTYHLVARGLVPELVDVVERRRLGVRGTPVARRRGRFYAEYPFFEDDGLRLPRSLYRLRQELDPVAEVERLSLQDGLLHIEGRAFMPGLGAPSARLPRMLGLLRPDAGKRRALSRPRRVGPLRVRRSYRPDVTADVYHPQESLDWSGFLLVVDPKRLTREQAWRVDLVVQAGAEVRTGTLRPARNGGQGLSFQAALGAGLRLQAGTQGQEGLQVRVERVAAELVAHEVGGGSLTFHGTLVEPTAGDARLRLRRRGSGDVHELALTAVGAESPTAPGTFTAQVPLDLLTSDLGPNSLFWDVSLVFGENRPAPLAAAEGMTEGVYGVDRRDDGEGRRELVVDRTREGNVRIRVRHPRPLLTEASWHDGRLRLAGTYCPDGDGSEQPEYEIVVRHRATGREHRWPLTVSGERFTATVTPFSTSSMAGTLPLPAGPWAVGVSRVGTGYPAEPHPVEVAEPLRRMLPVSASVRHKQVLLEVSRGRPVLTVTRDLEIDERGGYLQQQLKTQAYPEWRQEPPTDVVLYSSFNGQQYSDSPRAIHEELVRRDVNLRHLWVVRDGQVELPATAQAVREDSREYYEALARARYLVVNDHLRQWFERREDQVLVQTWHGTPLKSLGFDLARTRPATRRYLDGLYRQTRSWQYMLSPNAFSSSIFQRAYRLESTILEMGYPRNDIFFRPERHAVADAVRARLGIPEGRRVVLYAPTYRDHDKDAYGRHRLGLRLDLHLLRRALGDDHMLLVRRHRYVVDPIPGDGDGFVLDVSDYPDIADLMLVADVLITDYSSVMFDFANTSRPIVFFTYDLSQYRDELRGMYFDLAAEAPGPLLTTSDQVAEAVRAADAVRAEHEHRYRPFVERFCAADDGNAAARVVDRVFADVLPAHSPPPRQLA